MIRKNQDVELQLKERIKLVLFHPKLVNVTKQTELLIGKSQDVELQRRQRIILVCVNPN